jgi:hypothetical protein
MREGEGVAAQVLETLGAEPAKIRTQVWSVEGCERAVREEAWEWDQDPGGWKRGVKGEAGKGAWGFHASALEQAALRSRPAARAPARYAVSIALLNESRP